jgi:hypothetical protein
MRLVAWADVQLQRGGNPAPDQVQVAAYLDEGFSDLAAKVARFCPDAYDIVLFHGAQIGGRELAKV